VDYRILIEIGAVLGAIVVVIGFVKSALKPINDVKKALRSALKYSIVRAHYSYMKDGKISRMSLQSLCDMHDQYTALGGNGFIDELANELKSLPVDIGN
jgi:hypothetical protein